MQLHMYDGPAARAKGWEKKLRFEHALMPSAFVGTRLCGRLCLCET